MARESKGETVGTVVDPIVLSDGFGGIVDTHGIIRGILITGNPTKHPYHPPMLSPYVIPRVHPPGQEYPADSNVVTVSRLGAGGASHHGYRDST